MSLLDSNIVIAAVFAFNGTEMLRLRLGQRVTKECVLIQDLLLTSLDAVLAGEDIFEISIHVIAARILLSSPRCHSLAELDILI